MTLRQRRPAQRLRRGRTTWLTRSWLRARWGAAELHLKVNLLSEATQAALKSEAAFEREAPVVLDVFSVAT
jgi:hypothetical protein